MKSPMRIGRRSARPRIEAERRKQVEEELRVSQRRLQDFAEVSSDWFWETDADLRFVYFSNIAASAASISDALSARRAIR